MSLSPTKGSLVIRLWHRVGTFRTLSILVLLAGVVGGVLIADRQTQQNTASAKSAQAIDVPPDPSAPENEQDVADKKDAQNKATDAATSAAEQAKAVDEEARRREAASRSGTRNPTTAGPVPASCKVYTGNRATGCTLMLQWGFGIDQAPCLINLWNKESGWNPLARNRSTGAYGIPQALPATKMAVYGSDYLTNPVTQIKWGLDYIKGRYKTPCGAWSHFQSTGWY